MNGVEQYIRRGIVEVPDALPRPNWKLRAKRLRMSDDDYVLMLEDQVSMYRKQLDLTRASCLHAGMFTGAFHAEAALLSEITPCQS